jgi:uncharacterized protein
MSSSLDPQKIIEYLNLKPLQFEGGFFRRTYTAPNSFPSGFLPAPFPAAPRPFSSAIYFFLTDEPDCFSTMHRLPNDEIYHFYLGDPVELLLLLDDGSSHHVTLGSDILAGQQVQFVVPQGVWQGSRLLPGGRFALLGNTLSPAFENSDFIEGDYVSLVRQYPHEETLIKSLTRH